MAGLAMPSVRPCIQYAWPTRSKLSAVSLCRAARVNGCCFRPIARDHEKLPAVVSPPSLSVKHRSEWLGCEGLHEALNHVIVFSLVHFDHVAEYVTYYHECSPHQGGGADEGVEILETASDL